MSIWPLIYQYNIKNLSLLKSMCSKCVFHKQKAGAKIPQWIKKSGQITPYLGQIDNFFLFSKS
jgi:hypothetical protein